jgi:hypothetical protein
MQHHRTAQLLLLMSLCAGPLIAGDAEKLTPASLSPRADSRGMNWDIQPDGQIGDGTNDCFDNGLRLAVNGAQFRPAGQAMQNAEGEFVLKGMAGQVKMTRRILIEKQRPVIRYIEEIVNATDKAVRVPVEIRSTLGGNCQSMLWLDGKPGGQGPQPKGVGGLVALQHQGQSRPSLVWWAGDAASQAVPTWQGDTRQFAVMWTVPVPAKSSRIIVHWLAQVNNLTAAGINPIAVQLWSKGRLVKPGLSPAQARLVANWKLTVDEDPAPGLAAVDALGEALGAERGADDLVAVGRAEGARMTGRLVGGPLAITTRQGSAQVEVAQIAASHATDAGTRLHLRTGETLVALHLGGQVQLTTGDGLSMPVDLTRALAVLAHKAPVDGKPSTGMLGVLRTADGDGLALGGLDTELPMATAWGVISPRLSAIDRIESRREPTAGWWVVLTDGSRFPAVPAVAELTVTTLRFGEQRMPAALVTGFERGAAKAPVAVDDPTIAHAVVGDGIVLAGSPTSAMTLTNDAGSTPLPLDRLATLMRGDDGTLVATLAGGGTVGGQLASPAVTVTGSLAWTIPAGDLRSWRPAKAEPPAGGGSSTAATGSATKANPDPGDEPAETAAPANETP